MVQLDSCDSPVARSHLPHECPTGKTLCFVGRYYKGPSFLSKKYMSFQYPDFMAKLVSYDSRVARSYPHECPMGKTSCFGNHCSVEALIFPKNVPCFLLANTDIRPLREWDWWPFRLQKIQPPHHGLRILFDTVLAGLWVCGNIGDITARWHRLLDTYHLSDWLLRYIQLLKNFRISRMKNRVIWWYGFEPITVTWQKRGYSYDRHASVVIQEWKMRVASFNLEIHGYSFGGHPAICSRRFVSLLSTRSLDHAASGDAQRAERDTVLANKTAFILFLSVFVVVFVLVQLGKGFSSNTAGDGPFIFGGITYTFVIVAVTRSVGDFSTSAKNYYLKKIKDNLGFQTVDLCVTIVEPTKLVVKFSSSRTFANEDEVRSAVGKFQHPLSIASIVGMKKNRKTTSKVANTKCKEAVQAGGCDMLTFGLGPVDVSLHKAYVSVADDADISRVGTSADGTAAHDVTGVESVHSLKSVGAAVIVNGQKDDQIATTVGGLGSVVTEKKMAHGLEQFDWWRFETGSSQLGIIDTDEESPPRQKYRPTAFHVHSSAQKAIGGSSFDASSTERKVASPSDLASEFPPRKLRKVTVEGKHIDDVDPPRKKQTNDERKAKHAARQRFKRNSKRLADKNESGRKATAERIGAYREDKEYCESERKANAERIDAYREDKEYSQSERKANSDRIGAYREDEE